MDASEADLDIKLQKISSDLLDDFDRSIHDFLWKSDGHGGSRVRSRVRAKEAFRLTSTLLDPFQELPQLLDPYLPKWIPLLAEALLKHLQTRHRGKTLSSRSKLLVSVESAICKILYTFCKIRGEKIIVRFLNVETKYLELLLLAIEDSEQASEDEESLGKWSWEERYVVLLWLSHLLLAPFDLSTISSVDLQDIDTPEVPGMKWPANLPAITVRMIPLAIKYLRTPGKERDAAKALLVRMATRRDMQELGVLGSLMNWSLASLRPQKDTPPQPTYFYLGVLSFVAGVLRSSSDTSDMNPYLSSIFYAVHAISTTESELSKTIVSFALARKMILKVIRTIVVLLLRQTPQDMASTELTETAIGYLLECLADNDTPVRFAASKALSIITLKLDPDMASQVVEAVLESLNRNVLWTKTNGAKPTRDLSAVNNLEWHGLMLTLSHLLYRRSPPAAQLSDIIHALLLGLSFEQRSMSGGSIGSNVRDAACFGIWALARRYSTEELLAIPTQSVFAAKAHPSASSILQVLGTELVITASLDPAGNIRRGSSAALQELIGRHPDTVEQGIWVVQAVDYHAVARRSRAIDEVAVGAAKLANQYGEAVMDTIIGWRGIGDLDAPSRRVSGATFGLLTLQLSDAKYEDPLSRFRASIQLIETHLKSLQARQVEERHGLLLCLASTLDCFPTLVCNGVNPDIAIIYQVLALASVILDDLQSTAYRRVELLAEAASRLVVSLLPILRIAMTSASLEHLPSTGHNLLSLENEAGYLSLVSAVNSSNNTNEQASRFLSSLRSIIPKWLNRNEVETIGPAAEAALTLLIFSQPDDRNSILDEWAQLVQDRPTSRATSHGNGYFHALTISQPLAELSGDVACKAILERWHWDNGIETRVAILQSLTQSRVLHNKATEFLELITDSLNDYTTNARGDVGSHVRVQGLRAVRALWSNLGSASASGEWAEASVRALFFSVLRLSAEKLDRVRPEAQIAVALVLEDSHSARFRELTFSSKTYFQALLNLHSVDHLRPLLRDLAMTDPGAWMAELLAGFVTSADTGNEDLVIASRAALSDYCEASQENLDLICKGLHQNLKTHQGQDRVLVPTLEITAFLFHVGFFQQCAVDFRNLCLQTQKAGYKTGNVRKLEACIKVYGGIASMGDQAGAEAGVQEARKRLGALFYHPWPRVRSMVVDALWGLLGDQDDAAYCLKGVDWGLAKKPQIKAAVEDLRL
ncbi:tubulin folding cofactor D C terminal-domain-containing protein [Dactylonectria macrodidyma]|uniref:Tubulin folding cofactor D C terminal-domain-containing protein n=1 Tax=Dactylonectria macrodidyma TaxID=307937 RepID=A0A9P9FH41_9HYPO|nr:tubulin folding cofactor D C terminal-domain-containing protein [Dactylonectria macrodidyma]